MIKIFLLSIFCFWLPNGGKVCISQTTIINHLLEFPSYFYNACPPSQTDSTLVDTTWLISVEQQVKPGSDTLNLIGAVISNHVYARFGQAITYSIVLPSTGVWSYRLIYNRGQAECLGAWTIVRITGYVKPKKEIPVDARER